MKVDFSQKIMARGEPVKFPNEKGVVEDLTLGSVAYRALNAQVKEPLSSAEALRRGLLSLKIDEAEGPIELKAEEAALVQSLLSTVWVPAVCARAHAMLEGPVEPVPDKNR